MFKNILQISKKFSARESNLYNIANSVAEEVFALIKIVITYFGKNKEVETYEKQLKLAKGVNIQHALFMGLCDGLLSILYHLFFAVQYWYVITLLIQLEDKDRITDIAIVNIILHNKN